MFNVLDHLSGLQLVAVLLPVFAVMSIVRYREDKAGSIPFDKTNSLQKGWLFLGLLSPGLMAKVLTMLDESERQRLIEAGALLQGTPARAALPTLHHFFLANGEKGTPSKDVQEACRILNLKFQDDPKLLVSAYRRAYF